MLSRSSFSGRDARRAPQAAEPPVGPVAPAHYIVNLPDPSARAAPPGPAEVALPAGSRAAPERDASGAIRRIEGDDILDLLPAAPRKRVARREERVPTTWIAMAHLPDGEEIPCNVKDISKSGARIGIPEYIPLADRFVLRILGREFGCQVKVAWRRGNYVGLMIEHIYRLRKPAKEG